MSGPFVWWQNRKSRMGMKPSAKAPPHEPGKPWWTTPPTTLPQPEYIEYVVQFACELMQQRPSAKRNAMQAYVGAWLKAARRLLHEEKYMPNRADLHTTDGLIVAASGAMQKMRSRIYGLGGDLSEDVVQVLEAMQGRADKIRRERAMESAKRASRVTHPQREERGR